MKRRRQILIVVAVGLVAALSGIGTHLWRLAPDASAADTLWGLRLPDLAGQQQDMAQWRGKVVIVNFWATWCAPCREEIPAFVKLQAKYGSRGAQFVGIAIDQPDKVAAFARDFGMNYAILLGGIDTVDMTRHAGNRIGALPFTVILGRDGRIVSSELGKAKEADLERLLQKQLQR